MATRRITVVHDGAERDVALFAGLEADELSDLLTSVFKLSNDISVVGFSDADMVIPISLVCRSPEILPEDTALSLILQDAKPDTSTASEEERITASAKEQILRFVKGLVNRDLLSDSEADSLRNLLQENSSILFAAYSVALSSNDAAYMAEICRDLALSLRTEAGRLACEAQAEVFQVCDQLYSAGHISENQLLYLRHLVLIRDEGVAQIYDDYQNHLDDNTLGKNLLVVANQVPDYDDEEDEDDEDEEYDEDEDEYIESTTQGTQGSAEAYSENSETGRAPVVPSSYDEEEEILKNTLNRVAVLLWRGDEISYQQKAYLEELIEEKNTYLVDAFESYERYGNLDNLKQAMVRVAQTLQLEPSSTVEASPSRMTQQEAYAAIASAKEELLNHSLDMLVKQNFTTQDDADSLFARAKKGYALVDAAIDQYAQDKNLPDFLETLSILANNSPETLEKIINSEAGDEDEGNDEESNDDDDDDDDDDENGLARPQLDLLGVVSKLSEHHIIDETQKLALVRLVSKSDNRVMSAYRDYTNDKNSNALIETLVALANIEVRRYRAQTDTDGIEMVEKRASREQPPPPPPSMKRNSPTAPPPVPTTANTQTAKLLDSEDQLEIIEILTMHKQLTESKAKLLHALVVKEDRLVHNIFSEYENTKDIRLLIRKLQSIDVDDLRASESDDEEDLDDSESEDDEDDEDDESLENEDRESIESVFSKIVQQMRLSPFETAALRLAIAKNDPAIRGAMESYRSSRDAQGLVNNLKQISRNYAVEFDMQNDFGEDDEDDDEEGDDEDDEYLRELEREAGYERVGDENEILFQNIEDTDENDEFSDEDDDDDDDDYDDDLTARDQIFPVLVNELNKENIITETDRGVLLNLFASNNSVLNSALDAYDVDNNLGQLVDTLRQVASRYCNNRG